MTINKDFTFISGGQTGVDRAALDFAMENNIPIEGWCPKGRKAEDGPIPIHFPLKETKSANYEERTKKNIQDSEATLIIYLKELDKGSILCRQLCSELNIPFYIICLNKDIDIHLIQQWISNTSINKLNIAGPRESSEPGIYIKTKGLLKLLF